MKREKIQAKINEFALLMGFDLGKVSELIYKNGCEFAKSYYASLSAEIAVTNKLYWNWFLQNWDRTDSHIREIVKIETLGEDAWGIYHFMHLPGHMINGETFRCEPWEIVTKQVTEILFK